MGTNKQTHPSVNSVGEFNASGGFSAQSGISFRKVEPTVGSWWSEPKYQANRGAFQQKAESDAPRMSRGICGNHRAENAGIINWNF
jgi:hypothetical protein